jgi:8-oxo-dGTP diphosphatase
MISIFIHTPLLALLVASLVFNLTQRLHLEHGETKRFASLGISGLILLMFAGNLLIRRINGGDALLLIPLAAMAVTAWIFRSKLFIFRFRCSSCGSRLPIKTTLYYDHNTCDSCISDASGVRNVDDVDWNTWQPVEEAVLCFIVEDSKILLIHKKKGLGAGKISAPGGRIESGETARQASIRESHEEVGLIPDEPVQMADLSFIFTDGFSLHCSVFFAESYEGELTETDEADPFWCEIKQIPYSDMWADDIEWLPSAIAGDYVSGRFIFDGDTMLSKAVEIEKQDS